MNRLIGKVLCRLPKWLGGGHKRGRREGVIENHAAGLFFHTFACPRCGATWMRKVKKEAQ